MGEGLLGIRIHEKMRGILIPGSFQNKKQIIVIYNYGILYVHRDWELHEVEIKA